MPYKRRFGIVCIIDALGIKTSTILDCGKFLNTRKEIIKNTLLRWAVASSHEEDSGNNSKVDIFIQSFADNVVIAVEMKEFSSVSGVMKFPSKNAEADALFYGMWLERISYILGDLLRDALINNIVFRGALSAGEYLLDRKSNSVLGPVVNDVANWYESFNANGIILTPHASSIIDLLATQRTVRKSIIKSKIPFKDKSLKDQYVVNWPNAFLKGNYSKENIEIVLKKFLLARTGLVIPPGTESKYEYLDTFFNEVINRNLTIASTRFGALKSGPTDVHFFIQAPHKLSECSTYRRT